MPFVKLDCNILNSSLWIDRDARECFITALCLAYPYEVTEPMETIRINSLEADDFVVSPGWYGFVPSSGPGIVARASVPREDGLKALERLSSTDADSRNPNAMGRRMVRVDGGFIILNYDKYRQKDATAAERSRRYRETHMTVTRDDRDATPTVTHVEGEGEGEGEGEVINMEATPPKRKSAKTAAEQESVRLMWNELAEQSGLNQCAAISSGRKTHLNKRLKEPYWRENYKDAIDRLKGIRWIRGENTHKWKATFDWFLRPDTVVKILEGTCDDSKRDFSCASPDDSAGLF